MMSVAKAQKQIKDINIKTAKREIKENSKVRGMLENLRYHFKNGGGWDIDHSYYLNETGLSNQVFNAVLELNGYRIAYSARILNVVIRKAK